MKRKRKTYASYRAELYNHVSATQLKICWTPIRAAYRVVFQIYWFINLITSSDLRFLRPHRTFRFETRNTQKKHFDPEQNRCSFCFLKKKDHPNRSKRNPMRIYSRCNSFINRFLFEMEAKKRMRDENRLRFSVSITIYWYEKSVFFCSWIISFTLKVWFETWCRRFLFGFF